MIFLSALVMFLAGFGVYAFIFGDVDGLPLLPPQFVQNDQGVEPRDPDPKDWEGERERRIRLAFGNECEELKRKSLVYLPSKGIVLAIDKFEILPDGRVKISPCSVGMFPKSRDEVRVPEINTIQCAEAFLTMDRPVTSLAELGKGKVVAVELGGASGIKITNNRKTLGRNDDLELFIPASKLYYEDARNLIWTDGYVKLLDTQSQPLPTQITAIGLEVLLNKEASPNRDKVAKASDKKAEGVSGVEKIILRGNVDMHLYIDARSGFLAGQDETKRQPKTTSAPAEKAHVHIKTNGKFVYDLTREQARFDAPENSTLARDRVLVTRHGVAPAKAGGATLTDQLECDHLDLQFRKKKTESGESTDKDIEYAVATAKTESIVEMHGESEETHAFAAEMRYFAPTLTSGPRTILKGSPMTALRQGHQIQCEELHLKGADKKGEGQEAFAKGPGKIDLLDKKTGRSPSHILFKNSFTSTKDRDGDRVYELLTLRGDAAFIDDDHQQELRASQFLHVWLEEMKNPPVSKDSSAAAKDSPIGSRHRPHKIEGFENVTARSPELIIRHANHLTVCFREVAPPPIEKGVPALPAVGVPQPPPIQPVVRPKDSNDPGAKLLPPISKDATGPEPAKEKPRKPIELTAGEITAYVAVIGSRKELLEFVAEGNVHVHQEPEAGKEKDKKQGLDITGTMINLVRQPRGDILSVFGESRKLAQLQFGEMLLFGPKVVIDQVENVAHVEGTGAMHMPSNTTLDGKKKDSHITVHWNKSMWFNGRTAEFEGGVEAFQENGKIRCQGMQVTLDKPVEFKQTAKGSPSAKVDKILCSGKDDQRVFIVEEDRALDGKLSSYRRLQLAIVEVDNTEQRLNGSGPGQLDFLGLASADNAFAENDNKNAKPNATIMKWTRVYFTGQMISYPTPSGKSRQTTFIDQVRVYHQPGDDANIKDPTSIGKEGLFLTCQRLNIVTTKTGDKSSQELNADGGTGLVNFQAQDMQGTAKKVKYDERQELIIFEGAPATLYKMPKVQGAQPQRIQGTKILYNKKTGEFLLDGVRVISSWLLPVERPHEMFAMAKRD